MQPDGAVRKATAHRSAQFNRWGAGTKLRLRLKLAPPHLSSILDSSISNRHLVWPVLGCPGRAEGHRGASSAWQEVTPQAFIRPPSWPRFPWVSNYVRIASYVSFLMALIPLPLHWTSEGWKCSSKHCHRLPGKIRFNKSPNYRPKEQKTKPLTSASVNPPFSIHFDFSILQGVLFVKNEYIGLIYGRFVSAFC